MDSGSQVGEHGGGAFLPNCEVIPMDARRFFVVGLLVAGLNGCSQGRPVENEEPGSNPLVGVWLITETSVTEPTGTSVNQNPEAGLYVFTEHHFSNILIPGSLREPLSAERTDEERLAAFDNFIADAGTYDYKKSTLTARNIIAKIPNVMPPHRTSAELTYRWRLEGDELILILQGGWAPPDGEISYRLTRLE